MTLIRPKSQAPDQLPEDTALVLDGSVAWEAGFVEAFGEADSMRVLAMDTNGLLEDGAVVEAHDHRSASLLGITP